MRPASQNAAPRNGQDSLLTVATLREIGLFGALTDEILDHLTRTLATVRRGAGESIFREGDGSVREMYVVLEGEIDISKRSRGGTDIRIAILGPGDWFGEMSMIDMQPRSASARALAPSRLIRIRSADLDGLYRFDLKSYALIVLNIARDLSRRLRVTDRNLADCAANMLELSLAAKKP